MPEEFKAGCQRPAIPKKPTDKVNDAVQCDIGNILQGEENQNMIKVGKPAPDFTAPAFMNGKFANVSLSEYKGKWVVLCFYPGDFTFV